MTREAPGTWAGRLSLRDLADWLAWVEVSAQREGGWESIRVRIVAELDRRLGLA